MAHKKKRRGLRGLSGTPTEHEAEARRFIEASVYRRGEAMRAKTRGKACSFALEALATSGQALAEVDWTAKLPSYKALRSRVVDEYAHAKESAKRHCGCRGAR